MSAPFTFRGPATRMIGIVIVIITSAWDHKVSIRGFRNQLWPLIWGQVVSPPPNFHSTSNYNNELPSLLFTISPVWGFFYVAFGYFARVARKWRRQDQRLYISTQWRAHLNRDKYSAHIQHDLPRYFKTTVCGLVWTHDLVIHCSYTSH